MLAMLRDLVAHKWHANAALLGAIRQNEGAVSDSEISNLLHHILIANRFWLLTTLGLPFVLDDESRPAGSFGALVRRYARTQADEEAWLETATDSALERILEGPLIPHGACSVSHAFMFASVVALRESQRSGAMIAARSQDRRGASLLP